MCAKTTVAISPSFTKDRMWLNGVEETMQNPRLRACVDESINLNFVVLPL